MATTKNYVLGRGKLFFDMYTTGTKDLTGERYIGSTSEFSLNITSETLDHMNMESGIRSVDSSALLENKRAAAFTTDQIDVDNLSAFILGDGDTLVVAGGAVVAEPINNVKQDRYYQLGYDAVTNPTGVRNVSAVAVKEGVTTYVLDTDYTVDTVTGRLYIVEGGGIANGTNLTVDYTEAAHSRTQVISSSSTKLEGALRFVSDNAQGENVDYYMPYVMLTPNGDYALKGDDWQNIGFNVNIMEQLSLKAIYADGRPFTP